LDSMHGLARHATRVLVGARVCIALRCQNTLFRARQSSRRPKTICVCFLCPWLLSMLQLYKDAGVPTKNFIGVPVFQAEGLTVTTQDMVSLQNPRSSPRGLLCRWSFCSVLNPLWGFSVCRRLVVPLPVGTTGLAVACVDCGCAWVKTATVLRLTIPCILIHQAQQSDCLSRLRRTQV
jgi:hypothetical protein